MSPNMQKYLSPRSHLSATIRMAASSIGLAGMTDEERERERALARLQALRENLVIGVAA